MATFQCVYSTKPQSVIGGKNAIYFQQAGSMFYLNKLAACSTMIHQIETASLIRSALQIGIIYVIIHKIQSKGRESVEYVPIAVLKVIWFRMGKSSSIG